MKNCGFFVSDKYHHLGGSPDGITFLKKKNYLVEVKWVASKPYRKSTILECSESMKHFCVKYNEQKKKYMLKRNHNYYY